MKRLHVLMTDPGGQRFDCHRCTNCCRELVVHLTAADRRRIDEQDWRGRLGVEPYEMLHGQAVLNHRPGGGCVFLQADGRCRIHVEHGGEFKPLACRMYPFAVEAQGGAHRALPRFDCPSVARNAGQPLKQHRAEVEQIAGELGAEEPKLLAGAGDRWFLKAGRPADEAEVAAVTGAMDEALADREVPLGRRVSGAWRLIEALRAARLDTVREERFIELAGLLKDDSQAAAGGAANRGDAGGGESDDEPRPTSRQTSLFRQAVFAHCEHLTLAQAQAGWLVSTAFRWRQLARARRFIRGTSPVSDAIGGAARLAARYAGGDGCGDRDAGRVVSHEQVAAVAPCDGGAAAAADELATRYLRSRIVGRSAFGNGYYGWPVLDGLAALMLAFAVCGWLGRYFAARGGRTRCEVEDFVRAVGVVDRAAGRAPELGARSASLRVSYLCEGGGVLRLLRAWRWTRAG